MFPSVWRLSCLLSVSPFIFSLRSFLSLRLSRVSGAIVCLRLVYEEHWFTHEVWLARTRSVRRGGGGGEIWMNLLQYSISTLLFPNSPISVLPLYMLIPRVALFHCARVSECVFAQSQTGGQHWPEAHFCGRASVYPDGLQASRGPAPPSSSIPSPRGLSREPLRPSHCLVISRFSSTQTALGFQHLLRVTDCDCETCWEEEDEEGEREGGGGVKYSKTGKNIESGFHGSAGNGKSWTEM